MRLLQGTSRALRKPSTLEPNLIRRPNLSRVPIGNHKRRNVLDDFCAPTRHRVLPDAAKLMNPGQPSDDRMVSNRAVTT